MIDSIGIFSFDTKSNGGVIDDSIINLLQNNGYLIQKISGSKYHIFKEEEDNDSSDYNDNNDGSSDDNGVVDNG